MKKHLFSHIITLFVTFLLVVIIIIGSIFTYYNYLVTEDLTKKRVDDVLSIINTQVLHFINHPEIELREFIRDYENDKSSVTEKNIDSLSPFFKYIYRVERIDAKGQVTYCSPSKLSRVGFDLKRNEIFKLLQESEDEFTFGNTMIDPMTGEPAIFVGMPYENGYFVAYLELSVLQSSLDDLRVENGILTIVDRDGKYLTHPNREYVEQRSVDPNYNRIVMGDVVHGQKVEYQRESYYLFYNHIDQIDFQILYYINTSLLYRPLVRVIAASILFLIVMVVIVIYLIRKVFAYLNESMDELMIASDAIAKGDYSLDIKDFEYIEFNDLYQSFQHMSYEVETREEEILSLNSELENSYYSMISALAKAIEAKDYYTGNHCERVRDFSLLIGNYMNLSSRDMKQLKYGSTLHDVGKLSIPEAILNKPGGFTDEEYLTMQRHTVNGYDILKNSPMLEGVKEIILYHHERYDGSGYPSGLKGEEIPLLARIVSIADAYDAMTSKRLYREGVFTKEEALMELMNGKETQFDGKLVDIFIKALHSSTKI